MARAVMAAAQVYGDDPVRALTAQRGIRRRCVTPAAYGLSKATGLSFVRVAAVLRIRAENHSRSALRGGETYAAAVVAAERAARYAAWRPEARESLAPAEAPPVEAPPPIVEPETPAAPAAAAPEPPPARRAVAPPAARVPPADRPLRDLVLEAIAGGPQNTMSIACRIDRKEMGISSTLAVLEHEGAVRSEAVENGPRRLCWMLAEGVAS